ncbi:MAG: hypothetical protein FWE31_05335 [Firmicutes bacterium]|nr:hypothetical protein [Bacillota bacterium]
MRSSRKTAAAVFLVQKGGRGMSVGQFYRPYYFPSDGSLSGYGLSSKGIEEYVAYCKEQDPGTCENVIAHVSHDPDCTPKFNKQFLCNLGNSLECQESRTSNIIYRANHTVSLMKEDDTFLFLDSYNAFPVPDADHLPLLRFIRKQFPKAKIYTLHDKIQNDYHNCAFFATESACAIERALQENNQSLSEYIQFQDTRKVHTPRMRSLKDCKKMFAYSCLGVETIPIPRDIVPLVQSLTLVDEIVKGCTGIDIEDVCAEIADIRTGQVKKRNICISTMNEAFRSACLSGQTPSTRSI